ncbi:protein TolQ [Tsuneonella amylolytica]|uniref:protein TolQ n=1 Tax=Tsuneonella amylolytica TaxID=2338327 RepID=UPI000EA94DDB|nr:protein TolQ [Tsuneonella amylolytica]
MTDLITLAAATAGPGRLDPVQLFLDADIVVQAVMLGLLLASVWTWTIIVSFSMRMAAVRRRCRDYETDFWEADSFDALMAKRGKKDIASARVAAAGMREWKASVKNGRVADRDGLRQRLAGAMHGQVAVEADELANRLNFLATVGSVAPFVGLFGTVWGIMNSFFQIGQQQNSSLAVVAPGISEALFATAIGLFAAIPAVIAYNRFSHSVNAFEARMQRFADRFHTSLSREIEAH